MTALNTKLRRDAAQNWLVMAAVSAIIAVGIGSYISMMSAYRNLENTMHYYYGVCRLADFWIDLKKAPHQEVTRLTTIPGIMEIRPRIQFRVMLNFPKSNKPIGALLLSLPDRATPAINNIILKKGTYFTPGRSNEVIISEKFATARGLSPGDSISAILNNQIEKLYIVGTAISAEYVYMTSPGSMLDEPGSYGLMWIKDSFAENSFGFHNSTNSIVGLFSKNGELNRKQLLDHLTSRLEPYGVIAGTLQHQQFSPMVLEGEMTQLRSMAISLPSFFLVVAALVLNIMMTRMAEQQRTVIGTLKSLGYSNRELTLHFLKYGAIAGFAGGIGGCLIGYGFGAVMTEMYLFYFSFPHLDNIFYPELALSGIAISVCFALLGTVRGVWKAFRLEPAEAMRSASPPVGGAIFLEQFTLLWKRLHSQWQMIIRYLVRNKTRTVISIFVAAVGSSIVLLTFGFIDSLDEMINTQFEKSLRSDFHLSFSSELGIDALSAIKKIPGVVAAEPVLHLPCNFINGLHREKGVVTGLPAQPELTSVLDEAGRVMTLSSTGIVMSDRLMKKLHISGGDSIEIMPVKGNRRRIQVVVVQSISSIIGMGVFGEIQWLNGMVKQETSISEIRVKLERGDHARTRFVKAVKSLPGVEGITDIGGQKDAMVRQQKGLMRYSALVMIGFAAVIFLGTIVNTTLVSISERMRDIATFRTLGYRRSEVARLFLRENLVINMVGTCFGIPIGYSMLVSTMESFATDAYSMPSALYPESIFYTTLLSICFVLLAQLMVARKIATINWVEALSLKE